jgi:hypothetical protein
MRLGFTGEQPPLSHPAYEQCQPPPVYTKACMGGGR